MAADNRTSDAVAATLDAQVAWATAVAPRALSPTEADLVRARIEENVSAGRMLRRVALANGDEPGVIFVPFRAPDDHANADDAR